MFFWSNGCTLHYLKKVDITSNVTNIVLLRIYNERLRAKIRDFLFVNQLQVNVIELKGNFLILEEHKEFYEIFENPYSTYEDALKLYKIYANNKILLVLISNAAFQTFIRNDI